eukprot:1150138-Pelagomonas_calceolata.AAC.2
MNRCVSAASEQPTNASVLLDWLICLVTPSGTKERMARGYELHNAPDRGCMRNISKRCSDGFRHKSVSTSAMTSGIFKAWRVKLAVPVTRHKTAGALANDGSRHAVMEADTLA